MPDFIRDPALLPDIVSPRPERSKLFLGLDLGTTCGYAYAYVKPGEPISPSLIKPSFFGTWDLSAGPYDSGALRFVRLRQFLFTMSPDAIFFEDVRYVPPKEFMARGVNAVLSRAATSMEFFGALKATLSGWAEEANVPCGSFSITVIKKRATNRGNSGKPDIIQAANNLFGCSLDAKEYDRTGDDNCADAAFCLLLGLEQYGKGINHDQEAVRRLGVGGESPSSG